MTIAEWCLFGAAILPLLTLAPVKPLAGREFDNSEPRSPAFYEVPVRRRAFDAHTNGFEAFPFFAVSVLLAEFRHAPQSWVDTLAIAFLLARIAFVAAYVSNWSTLRTTLWNTAFAFNLAIFFLAGYGVRGAVIAMVVGLLFAIGVAIVLATAQRSSERASQD
jgi:uncharacterized MAPEG superfamily protein